jgi:UDP-N-acetylglucosamine transferase subunit ALG13
VIFVVLGTWEMPFVRPLREIEQAVKAGTLGEPIIVQSGKSDYRSTYFESTPFFGKDELERMYDLADLIICQAGVGSIMLGLRKNKKVIAVARREKYHEHIDDHQLEILQVFSKTGAVLPWNAEGDLDAVLKRARTFVSTGYRFEPERISGTILRYLDANVRG